MRPDGTMNTQQGWRVDVKHEIADPWEEWGWYSDLVDAKRAAVQVPYERARVVATEYRGSVVSPRPNQQEETP